MEKDAFVVGVGFKLATHGDHQIEWGFVTPVEVVLNSMVEIKGEAVAGLVPVRKGHGCGAV